MTTPVDICNRALSAIGSQRQIGSLEEQSPSAVQCSIWYDNQRQGLLRSANWGFARRQIVLSQIGDLYPDGTAPYPLLWKYAYPADCVKFRYILPPPFPYNQNIGPQVDVGPQAPILWKPSRQHRFLLGVDVDADGNQTRSIASNVQNAFGVYTCDVTNCNVFDTLFESALTSSLAYHFCLPNTGNAGMRASFADAADKAVAKAQAMDGTEAIATTDHTVDWIAGRGNSYFGGYGYGYGGGTGYGGSGWGEWYGQNDTMTWGM